MSDTDTQPAMTYPTEEQYEGWKAEADEKDMSVSKWMQAMVEAGRKKFDAQIEPDEENRKLRRQRNDLKEELERARDRISRLENQLHRGEQAAIKRFIFENPGATFSEITQHIIDNAPERVNRHIEELEGDALRVEDGEYYPAEGETDE